MARFINFMGVSVVMTSLSWGPIAHAEEGAVPEALKSNAETKQGSAIPAAPQSTPEKTTEKLTEKALPVKKLPAQTVSQKNSSELGAAADEQRDYQRASDLLKNGKEPEAIISWTDFLRRYPTSSLAVEAQFMLGETFFKQRKFDDAIAEYAKVFRYGLRQSDKAAQAALRTGECWYQLKQYERARIEWEAVRRKFPTSDAASKAHSLIAGLP